MKTIHINNKGLLPDINPYLVPDGSLVHAKNVNIESEGIIKSRKGFETVAANIQLQNNEVFVNLVHFADHYIILTNKRFFYIPYDGNSLNVGEAIHTIHRDYFIFLNRLFIPSKQGIMQMSSEIQVRHAGIPTPLKPVVSLIPHADAATTAATLPANKQVIYRIVYREPGTSIRSAPSFPVRITNNLQQEANPSLKIIHPLRINRQYEVEIYRSHAVDRAANLLANDELFRVKVLSIGSQNSLSFIDIGNELELPLYTNASIEGIENANYLPPHAQSMCMHKGMACYANITRRATITLKMKPLTLIAGRIRITNGTDSIELQAGSQEDLSRSVFKINEATSLRNVIQQHVNNTFVNVYDIHVENLNEPTLLLESIYYDQKLQVEALDDTEYTHALINALSITSPEIAFPIHEANKIYFSKFEEPYSVPLYRYFSLGRSDKPIIKIVSFRDTLFVFKEDGLFKIDGDVYDNMLTSNFLRDVYLTSKDSVAILEDQIYCFSSYGFIRINEHRYESINNPIEDKVLVKLLGQKSLPGCLGISLKQQKKYLFFYKYPHQKQTVGAYVYHVETDQWTQWDKQAQVAHVNENGHLLLLDYHTKILLKERHSASLYDWRDESFSVTLEAMNDAYDQFTITKTNPFSFPIRPGLFFSQGLSYSCIDAIIHEDDAIITLKTKDKILIDASQRVEISKPIEIVIFYNRLYFDDPTRLKKIDSINFLLGDSFQKKLLAYFKTDISTYHQKTYLQVKYGLPYGSMSWGEQGFGGNQPISQHLKTFAPRNKNIFHWIEIGVCSHEVFNPLCLLGLSVEYHYIHTSIR